MVVRVFVEYRGNARHLFRIIVIRHRFLWTRRCDADIMAHEYLTPGERYAVAGRLRDD
jgi:hypothetical protein